MGRFAQLGNDLHSGQRGIDFVPDMQSDVGRRNDGNGRKASITGFVQVTGNWVHRHMRPRWHELHADALNQPRHPIYGNRLTNWRRGDFRSNNQMKVFKHRITIHLETRVFPSSDFERRMWPYFDG